VDGVLVAAGSLWLNTTTLGIVDQIEHKGVVCTVGSTFSIFSMCAPKEGNNSPSNLKS